MRVAAIYDIHGNLPALEAVLAEIDSTDVDLLVVGGDVVPGPMPAEAIALLDAYPGPCRFIVGNGEHAVLAAMADQPLEGVPEQALESIRWNAEVISEKDAQAMAGWPSTVELNVPGIGRVLFCHATPGSDTDIFTRLTPEDRLRPIFDAVDADVVVCGHTHMQFDRRIGSVRVVNAGSVGMPFGDAGAYWLLLGPDVELRHTEYALVEAADRIRATRYPDAARFAENNVLLPPGELDMIRLFEPSADV